MEIAKIKFSETSYYIYKDGIIYRRAAAGDFKERWSIHRKVGHYKIHSEHFDCALPYTVYYLIDTKNDKIYKSEDCHSSMINEIVEELKKII